MHRRPSEIEKALEGRPVRILPVLTRYLDDSESVLAVRVGFGVPGRVAVIATKPLMKVLPS